MGTLATPIEDPDDRRNPNIVKAVIAFDRQHPELGRGLYFSRATVPAGDGPIYHHIGIYGYRVRVLRDFCAWPPSALELAESLEQLRLLANDVPMLVLDACADVPLGVDTPADLARVRAQLEG